MVVKGGGAIQNKDIFDAMIKMYSNEAYNGVVQKVGGVEDRRRLRAIEHNDPCRAIRDSDTCASFYNLGAIKCACFCVGGHEPEIWVGVRPAKDEL